MPDIKAVLLDISGVLYEDDAALPGAVQAVKTLQQRGLALGLVTNTSRRTSEAIYYDLKRMGFDVQREQLFTAPTAIRAYLKAHALRPFCLIHEHLEAEFAEVTDRHQPNAVVVCDAEHRFDYKNLNKAFQVLIEGAPLIAVGSNRYYRHRGRLNLDAGPFVKALEYAAECRAIIMGKPSEDFYRTVMKEMQAEPKTALMVGDDVDADVRGAMAAGLQACLVQTGKYRAGDEARAPGSSLARDLAGAVESLL